MLQGARQALLLLLLLQHQGSMLLRRAYGS
jgi:hypothetical protein